MSLRATLEARAAFYAKNIADLRDALDRDANKRLVAMNLLRVNEAALAEIRKAIEHEAAIEAAPKRGVG